MNDIGIEIGEVAARIACCSNGSAQVLTNLSYTLVTPTCCFVNETGRLLPGFRPSRSTKEVDHIVESVLLYSDHDDYTLALVRKPLDTAEIKTGGPAEKIVLTLPELLHTGWSSRLNSDFHGPEES
jgi:hypothetical protein